MKTIYFLLILLVIAGLSGCAVYTPIEACVVDPPRGFWGGLIDGLVAPIALICSLFTDSIEFYSVNNNGGWYNFGFALGIGGLTGTSSSASRR